MLSKSHGCMLLVKQVYAVCFRLKPPIHIQHWMDTHWSAVHWLLCSNYSLISLWLCRASTQLEKTTACSFKTSLSLSLSFSVCLFASLFYTHYNDRHIIATKQNTTWSLHHKCSPQKKSNNRAFKLKRCLLFFIIIYSFFPELQVGSYGGL